MQRSSFVVNETPYCVWEFDLHDRNLSFLDSIDSNYFTYLADAHAKNLDSDTDRQYAALALRTSYSHALESLLSLLFACLQAPDCVVGWLEKYKTNDLYDLISKVEAQERILNRLSLKQVTWENISRSVLLPLSLPDKEKENLIKNKFALIWSRFASEFSDSNFSKEYNCIKHGFRVKKGGFFLSIAKEESPGVLPEQSKIHSIGGSEFGTTFYISEKLLDNNVDFRIRQNSRNWFPDKFITSLHLISNSIHNIISFLRYYNGIEVSKSNFLWPIDFNYFDLPWKISSGITNFNIDTVIEPSDIKASDKNEIIQEYSRKSDHDKE